MVHYREFFKEEIEFRAKLLGVDPSEFHVHHIDGNRNNNNLGNLFVCYANYHYANYHPKYWDFKNNCWKSNWGQRAGWNKGLTKETDPRVKKSSDTLKKHKRTKSHQEKIAKANTGKRYSKEVNLKKASKGKKNGRYRHDLNRKQICIDYNSGLSKSYVADIHNTDPFTVRKILIENNIEIRSGSESLKLSGKNSGKNCSQYNHDIDKLKPVIKLIVNEGTNLYSHDYYNKLKHIKRFLYDNYDVNVCLNTIKIRLKKWNMELIVDKFYWEDL
jgi:hypothetical protein